MKTIEDLLIEETGLNALDLMRTTDEEWEEFFTEDILWIKKLLEIHKGKWEAIPTVMEVINAYTNGADIEKIKKEIKSVGGKQANLYVFKDGRAVVYKDNTRPKSKHIAVHLPHDREFFAEWRANSEEWGLVYDQEEAIDNWIEEFLEGGLS